jgi:hypothetical protein
MTCCLTFYSKQVKIKPEVVDRKKKKKKKKKKPEVVDSDLWTCVSIYILKLYINKILNLIIKRSWSPSYSWMSHWQLNPTVTMT